MRTTTALVLAMTCLACTTPNGLPVSEAESPPAFEAPQGMARVFVWRGVMPAALRCRYEIAGQRLTLGASAFGYFDVEPGDYELTHGCPSVERGGVLVQLRVEAGGVYYAYGRDLVAAEKAQRDILRLPTMATPEPIEESDP